jgi:4'-phosphopantetheinyl transferase
MKRRVDVHVADISEDVETERLETLLSPAEVLRLNRFHRHADRRRFAIGRAMIRALLAERLGVPGEQVELRLDERGRPHLLDGYSDLVFSISHAGDRVLCALASGLPLGVDVEPVRTIPNASALAARFFHPDETAVLARVPSDAHDRVFLTLWVRKEAYLKAIGIGLAGGLDTYSFLHSAETVDNRDERGEWTLADLDLGTRYVGAVAVGATTAQVIVIPWQPPGE